MNTNGLAERSPGFFDFLAFSDFWPFLTFLVAESAAETSTSSDDSVGICHSLPGPLSGRALRPRRGLCHHGRPAAVVAAALGVTAVAGGVVGNVAFVAHRTLLRSSAIPRAVPLDWALPPVSSMARLAFSRGDRT